MEVELDQDTTFLFSVEHWFISIVKRVKESPTNINPRYVIKKSAWIKAAQKAANTKESNIRELTKLLIGKNNTKIFRHNLRDIDNTKFTKEFDDIVSRMTSYLNWYKYKDLIQKFTEEINNSLVINPIKMPKLTQIKVKGKATIADGIITYQSIHISQYQGFIKRLCQIYPNIEPPQQLKIALLYYIQRSQSGSNWSPSLSYPDLEKYYDDDWGILECFCGIMNNQDLIHNRPITTARLCLDYKIVRECTGDEKFQGSWRLNSLEVIGKLVKEYKKVLLLVNPVYSEKEIILSFEHLNTIFETYDHEMKVLLTLPHWPDLYESDEFKSKLKSIKIIDMIVIEGDNIYNASSDETKKTIPFKFYTLGVIRA